MKKILIVEDVEWNRDLMVQILEEDFEVIEAEDEEKGLEMAMAEQPDLILMDMLLPEMNGWEVAAEIRKREAGKPVSVIAVSAQAMSRDENVALEAGCNAYVSKPIDEDELLEKIVELIGT